jgi:hypothetical protein
LRPNSLQQQLSVFRNFLIGRIWQVSIAGSNLNTPPLTNSTPGNAAYIVASFREYSRVSGWPIQLLIALGLADHTINKITPIVQGVIVTTVDGGPLIAGQANQLNISTGDPNAALDGAMIYAKTAAIQRVGSFVDPSGTFKNFPGCGRNGQGQFAGVIHQQVITCNVSLQISGHCSL